MSAAPTSSWSSGKDCCLIGGARGGRADTAVFSPLTAADKGVDGGKVEGCGACCDRTAGEDAPTGARCCLGTLGFERGTAAVA